MAWRVKITRIWLNAGNEFAAHWAAQDQNGRVETGGWFDMCQSLSLCVDRVLSSRGLDPSGITCEPFLWRPQIADNNNNKMRQMGAIRVRTDAEICEHHGKGLSLWLWNEHPSEWGGGEAPGRTWLGPMPKRDVEGVMGFRVVVYCKDKPDFDIL